MPLKSEYLLIILCLVSPWILLSVPSFHVKKDGLRSN